MLHEYRHGRLRCWVVDKLSIIDSLIVKHLPIRPSRIFTDQFYRHWIRGYEYQVSPRQADNLAQFNHWANLNGEILHLAYLHRSLRKNVILCLTAVPDDFENAKAVLSFYCLFAQLARHKAIEQKETISLGEFRLRRGLYWLGEKCYRTSTLPPIDLIHEHNDDLNLLARLKGFQAVRDPAIEFGQETS